MESNICTHLTNCPIFVKGVLVNEYTGVAYKNMYCLVSGKYKECKRYQVTQATGKPVPENIMPNSKKTLEELLAQINQK